MADLADHAYAHAVAVLGAGGPALDAAVVAVRRGGRSRAAVLGHARAEALARADEAATADLDGPVPDDLTDLAVALASTRPALERAIADLDTRHGLDRTALGRALGTSTAVAGTRATDVATTWEQTLDPVVLARLGPGGCDELASVLSPAAPVTVGPAPIAEGVASVPTAAATTATAIADGAATTTAVVPATLRELVALGPAVADHAAGCATCGDRLRAMVSVRTLLGQRPLEEAPHAVRAAAAPSRLRRPAPPPPLEPVGLGRRWLRPVVIVAAALAVALVGGVAAAALRHDDHGRPSAGNDLATLTRVPAGGSALVAAPAAVRGARLAPVRLTNHADRTLTWSAVADVEWLTVSPAEGRLDAGASSTLSLRISSTAPEGDLRAALQISGQDGSATVVRVETDVEHPPDVAATVDACTVSAVVEDEGELGAVELHWNEPTDGGAVGGTVAGGRTGSAQGRVAEHIVPMAPMTSGYTGQLPSLPSSIPWWIVAADARGNRSRTADAVLAPGTCAPSP
jgi:hypothetical protein